MRKKMIGFLLLFPFALRAQSLVLPLAAAYTRLSPYSQVHPGGLSFAAHPAALADYKKNSFQLYGERRFLLRHLGVYHAFLALPVPAGGFGLQGSYSGSEMHRENGLGLAYGRDLGKASLGVQFTYQALHAAGYNRTDMLSVEGGVLLRLSGQCRAGLHLKHPATLGSFSRKQRLPAVFTAGFGYDASRQFFMGAAFEKTEDLPVQVHAGFEYAIAEMLVVRGGLASTAAVFYGGLGFLLNGFRIDATASLHPQLGMTPGLMLSYPSKSGQ